MDTGSIYFKNRMEVQEFKRPSTDPKSPKKSPPITTPRKYDCPEK